VLGGARPGPAAYIAPATTELGWLGANADALLAADASNPLFPRSGAPSAPRPPRRAPSLPLSQHPPPAGWSPLPGGGGLERERKRIMAPSDRRVIRESPNALFPSSPAGDGLLDVVCPYSAVGDASWAPGATLAAAPWAVPQAMAAMAAAGRTWAHVLVYGGGGGRCGLYLARARAPPPARLSAPLPICELQNQV